MIDRLPLACLPIQTHIGKATFQFAIKWMHDNTSSKAKQSKAKQSKAKRSKAKRSEAKRSKAKQSKAKKDTTHLLPFAAGNPSLACLTPSCVRPVRPGQPTEGQRQASIINHFAIH